MSKENMLIDAEHRNIRLTDRVDSLTKQLAHCQTQLNDANKESGRLAGKVIEYESTISEIRDSVESALDDNERSGNIIEDLDWVINRMHSAEYAANSSAYL